MHLIDSRQDSDLQFKQTGLRFIPQRLKTGHGHLRYLRLEVNADSHLKDSDSHFRESSLRPTAQRTKNHTSETGLAS